MDYIDLKRLTIDELIGVVNIYPWFGGARKELCERMNRSGAAWGKSQCAEAAMYVGSRKKMAALVQSSSNNDWTDADVQTLIKSYIVEEPEPEAIPEASPFRERRIHVVGGDYFTQEDYDQVRRKDDNVFSTYAAKAKESGSYTDYDDTTDFDIYTETLAEIYAQQGYYQQARDIYSKLILAYPEKSAYFAALIADFEQKTTNQI